MLRSLNSAISVLKSYQLFRDMIGSNVANINTSAFKGNRATFQSILAQTLRGATALAEQRGGLNA